MNRPAPRSGPPLRVAEPELENPGDRVSERGDDCDRADLVALVTRYQAPIWRYLRLLGADEHEADDLMQETFVLASRRLVGAGSSDAGPGRDEEGELVRRPGAFLRGVARNLLLGARRRRRRRPVDVSWCDSVDEFVEAEPAVIESDRVGHLRDCLQQLSGRSRQAIEWHHLEGLEPDEVGRRLEVGPHGVKSLLSRARHALRECVRQREQREQKS